MDDAKTTLISLQSSPAKTTLILLQSAPPKTTLIFLQSQVWCTVKHINSQTCFKQGRPLSCMLKYIAAAKRKTKQKDHMVWSYVKTHLE